MKQFDFMDNWGLIVYLKYMRGNTLGNFTHHFQISKKENLTEDKGCSKANIRAKHGSTGTSLIFEANSGTRCRSVQNITHYFAF